MASAAEPGGAEEGGAHLAARYAIGIDFGTSGCRAAAVPLRGDAGESFESRVAYKYNPYDVGADDEPARAEALVRVWERALRAALLGLPADARARAVGVAVDGTSATTVVCVSTRRCAYAAEGAAAGGRKGRNGGALFAAMYDEAFADGAAAAAARAPPGAAAARSPTSGLAKLLHWRASADAKGGVTGGSAVVRSQADLLCAALLGVPAGACGSDWNNALKLGYDPEADAWPAWLLADDGADGLAPMLPRPVLPPGALAGRVGAAPAAEYGLPEGCAVGASTTDSVAAFLAAAGDFEGGLSPGDAVVSLGSTLAIKLVSESRVEGAAAGVYSHRLGDGTWLASGASNAGGRALLDHFDATRMAELSEGIDASVASKLAAGYYPLPRAVTGERFPVVDPDKRACVSPRPADDAEFLHALLESIARVERDGFKALEALGAPRARRVRTSGGGARNEAWTGIRRCERGHPCACVHQCARGYARARPSELSALTRARSSTHARACQASAGCRGRKRGGSGDGARGVLRRGAPRRHSRELRQARAPMTRDTRARARARD